MTELSIRINILDHHPHDKIIPESVEFCTQWAKLRPEQRFYLLELLKFDTQFLMDQEIKDMKEDGILN